MGGKSVLLGTGGSGRGGKGRGGFGDSRIMALVDCCRGVGTMLTHIVL